MFILYGVLITLVIGVIDVLLFAKDKKPSTIVYHLFCDVVLSTILALFVTIHVFDKSNIFVGYSPTIGFILKYLLLIIIICVVVIFVKGLLSKNLYFEQDKPKKNPKGTMALKVGGEILAILGTAAFSATTWGKHTFGDIAFDQMLITLTSPTSGTSSEVYNTAFEGPVLTTLLVGAIFGLIIFPNYKLVFSKDNNTKTVLTEYVKRIVAFVISVVMFVGGCWFGIARYHLLTMVKSYFINSDYIQNNFADPETTQITFPEKKRNLIHIYLESVENTYFSKDLGGNMDVNLMPDLAELSKEGYSFSHTENTFGGPAPNTGGTWSVASMVNQSTGLPMKIPQQYHYYGVDDFLPGSTTMGDILANQGYEQTIMFGADATFGGLDLFYKTHGNFRILDYKGAINQGWIDPDYYVWWGYEDDKLYEFAKAELTRLSQTGKPFNFVMENADTHFPDGYLSPYATKRVHESQYGNVIYYSQGEVAKFIRWIQEQPFYENTTIVLIGDHLSMDANFFSNYVDPDYKRTTFNLILNPDPSIGTVNTDRLYNRDWANFDLFPTILSSIGAKIEGDRLGIGTNLFSNEQTVFERDGVDYVNNEIEYLSNFYNEKVLLEEPAK